MTEIPPTLYTHEVLKLVKMSRASWKKMRDKKRAPEPKYRGKEGDVYFGSDIEKFLGLTTPEPVIEYDKIMAGTNTFVGS